MKTFVRFVTTALFWLVASLAIAQSTGSSFGGGDWSSGGGGGSSSGGGGYSGSSGYTSSGVSYDDPNAIELPYWAQLLVFVAFIALLAGLVRLMTRLQSGGGGKIDVALVQIALDARARAFVQTTLRNLGRTGDTLTALGRITLLKAAISALRSSRLAWIYAGSKSFDPMPPARAQTEFKRLADDARAGFQHELDRSVDGKKTSASAPEMRPAEHEGEGAVLVTILVAARTSLRDVRAMRADELDAALAQLAAIAPAQLVALEVVWTPAAENDRMSTDELEKHYPTLTKLEGAVGGRVYCASCRGPYAAELPKCPHCGAPAG